MYKFNKLDAAFKTYIFELLIVQPLFVTDPYVCVCVSVFIYFQKVQLKVLYGLIMGSDIVRTAYQDTSATSLLFLYSLVNQCG